MVTESIWKFYSAKSIVSELSRRMLAFLGDVDVMRSLQTQNVQSVKVLKLHLRKSWETRFQIRERPHVQIASTNSVSAPIYLQLECNAAEGRYFAAFQQINQPRRNFKTAENAC